jgi:hypothetical protein
MTQDLRTLHHAIADEMSDLADRLCKLACGLARDTELAMRHMDDLQSIDLMTQIQRALADLLREEDLPAERIGRIPVEALAMRLMGRIEPQQDCAA